MNVTKDLVPAKLISLTQESLVARFSGKSNSIYLLSILLVLIFLGILPIVTVDISVNAPSIFRAAQEPSVIVSPVAGSVKESFVEENKFVVAGDTLFELESAALTERKQFYRQKLDEVASHSHDLTILMEIGDKADIISLQSYSYELLHKNFQERLNELHIKLSKAKRDLDRNRNLYNSKVIAPVVYEGFVYEYERTGKEIEVFLKSQKSQWALELHKLEEERDDILGQLAVLQAEESQNYILAPLAGVLTSSKGFYKGGYVLPNQELVSISPTDSIIIMAYLSPADIGFIRKDMPVTLQVDAFDYNQWGLADARIIDVSENVKVLDGRPVFEVRCHALQTYLQLPNGYKGYLKNGMTAQSRFIIQQRTLWQLLFDKVDDWLNPNLTS